MSLSNQIEEIISKFSEFISAGTNTDPHTKILSFINSLVQIADIFKPQCNSTEEILLYELLQRLSEFEPKITGRNGIDFLQTLLKLIEHLFTKVIRQVEKIEKLKAERDQLQTKILEFSL